MADTRPTAVLERLIDDDYVQEQLRTGVARLRAAYRRAQAVRAHEAVQDKKLYDHIRTQRPRSLRPVGERSAGRNRSRDGAGAACPWPSSRSL
jgi:hypothetical protein